MHLLLLAQSTGERVAANMSDGTLLILLAVVGGALILFFTSDHRPSLSGGGAKVVLIVVAAVVLMGSAGKGNSEGFGETLDRVLPLDFLGGSDGEL